MHVAALTDVDNVTLYISISISLLLVFARERVKISGVITNSANCKSWPVIRFLNAREHIVVEIVWNMWFYCNELSETVRTLKKAHICAFLDFLNQEDDEFISHIVAGDEARISRVTVKI